MASSISRRRVIQGTAWATPIVIASSAVPVYASSREKCVPDISVPVNQNLTNDGSSTLEAFTIPAGVETVTFRITGGVGGSYRGLAMHGSGGRGALITGTLAVKENDVLKFVLAGGGAYNRDKPTEPGKGWANGGSHGPSYKTTDARTVKFFEGPNTAEEYYGPTGGGASAVFLNDKLIAVAGGGGGAGTRFYSYTVWNDMQSGPQPKEFLPLVLETTEAAQGGSGGAGNGANGSSFSEIYKFFPGPSIRANGGFAGENGKGGAGATTGGLRNMDSNASIVFATNDENDVFYEDVAGKSGEDATLDRNSLGNNGGTGGGSVVGRAFVDNRQFTHKYLHQGALVHSSTGGGGYGGGGSGSVTTAGAYASDQRWVKYDRGGWAPVGAAAVSGGAGAGGSYLTHDDALLEGQILPDLATRPATALSRINAVAELSWCRLPNNEDPKKENSDNKDNKGE